MVGVPAACLHGCAAVVQHMFACTMLHAQRHPPVAAVLLPCFNMILLQVALVAGIVAVAVFIGNLGEPIAENAIKSFPTPADYEAYEESK